MGRPGPRVSRHDADVELRRCRAQGLPGRPPALTEGLQHVFRRETRALGYEGLRFHDLRHTHITHLLHAGVNVKDVSARVGHASAAMTLDDTRTFSLGSQEAAVKALDGLLG